MNPFPRQVALAFCAPCDRTRFARWVNAQDAIPRRFCTRCGRAMAVALYTFELSLDVADVPSDRPPPPVGRDSVDKKST